MTNSTPSKPRRSRAPLLVRTALFFLIAAVVVVIFIFLSEHISAKATADINNVADYSLLLVGIPAGAFFIAFQIFWTNWTGTTPGRSVGILGICLELLLVVNAASIFLGVNYPGREFVRVTAYWGLCAAIIYLCYVVVQVNVTAAIKRHADEAAAARDVGRDLDRV